MTAAHRAARTTRTVRTAAAVLAVLALGGCGIRSTPVPVDAGAAPSRASCAAPGAGEARQPGDEVIRVDVFLVCGGGVEPVERTVPVKAGERGPDARLRTARALLDELQESPSRAEDEAGFGTAVPHTLEVLAPAEEDSRETLRLSQEPGRLPPFALAQIVCTFAGTAATGQEPTVVLGGPGPESGAGPGPDENRGMPSAHSCTDALRSGPETAETAGAPPS
ncbi:hypothetical protein V1L54_07980 [Streptomyces sp. TRM 70361]|uniref:hypothetical protein n=1 Tax=Streptomyces sp. TRM 70361 TaxID=3116553 RepID=UPI002E7AF337|nr:hypothetical protein [Streptomyces sp. TRM 70361]MEE1939352.1 hypothetical protein [Streptomyces sp. TRM 70361]